MPSEALAVNAQELTEEQYRQLCKQVRHYQISKGKKKKPAPILKPIGNTIAVEKKLIVQQSPCDWDDIPTGSPFALDSNGTLVYTKAGTNRALCLNTMTAMTVGGASVYRIFL